MDTNLFQFEYLPNEILIEIFQNLDIYDLFQAFYNLNIHLNNILHSINNLSLTLSRNNYNDFKLCDFSMHQISSLIIKSEIHVDLQRFLHIHCLVLLTPTFSLIQQLNSQIFPMLEHLAINFPGSSFPYTLSGTINKIFSNQFPQLHSCYLPKMEATIKNDIWSQVLTLRILKVGKLDLIVYKAILISCPNLYFLQFIKPKSIGILSSFETHSNLKRMIIELRLWCPGNLSDINIYLSQVPNLEQLTIYHADFGASMKEYLTYDWLSSSITNHLSLLRRFNYYFEMYYFGLSNTLNIEQNLSQIRDNFKKIHNEKYQSRLIIIQRF
jgi:hypothetical protein